jgi:predicted RNA binding protein YcfA (HicA-like mRNA interferase family)
MKKIPRDISGKTLIKYLKQFGYEPTRQSGSHVRLTTQRNGEHHVTIPNHLYIKVGTLSAILSDIASHFGKNKNEIIEQLF